MTEAAKPSNWNVPNALTVLRIVLVPVFIWVLFAHPHVQGWRWAATAIFVIAILTDLVDGKIARKYDLVTDFGKLWDPIADKALTGAAFIGLGILGELNWWIIGIILVREWGITWLREVIKKYHVMAANRGGKAKTVTQAIALSLYLLWLEPLPAWVGVIAFIIMMVALVLTVVTGIDYLRRALKIMGEGKRTETPLV